MRWSRWMGRGGGRGRFTARVRVLGALAGICVGAAPARAQDGIAGFVAGIEAPLLGLVQAVCVVAGILFCLFALFRCAERARERFGPSWAGTVARFLAGGALIQLGAWLRVLAKGVFPEDRPSTVVLAGGGVGDPGYDALIGALTTVVYIVGVVSVAWGIGLLKAVGDGRASPAQALCHIVGGTLCCNFAAVLEAVQEAAGVAVLEIS